MANWTKSEPQGSTRKKWNLEDRTSLKNLQYHMAEDGCSEIQYDLARQLLEENSDDPATNYAQGVHWLLRAAEQGHEGAMCLLSDCFRSRRGITDRNECEVQTFLTMTPGERAARKAARELFAVLSNGEQFITAAQLERKMREIYKMQKKSKRRKRPRRNSSGDDQVSTENLDEDEEEFAASTSNGGNHISPSPFRGFRQRRQRQPTDHLYNADLISEDNLIEAALNYANGDMPMLGAQAALQLSIPHPQTLDHIPCFHRLLFHPLLFFLLCYHRFIKAISSFPKSMSNVHYIVLLFLYALFGSQNLTMFVPMGLYYLTLIVMICASFKMLKAKHDFVDFRIWSGLFLSYGDANFDAAGSENQFLRNNMKPYLYFFIAFFGNVMLMPVISDQWMPHSEITVVAFILVFLTMFAFMFSSSGRLPDWLVLISFGVNVLAKYPYEMDTVVTTGWRFLDLKVPTFPSFVIGNGIEFCLNCRALLLLLIPGVLILLARRRSWHGTYQYLIPHCVTLSWLQICIISSQCATMFGLVRAALGLAGLLLFLPLFGIVTLMIPVFAAVEWLSLTDPTVRIAASFCTAAFAIIGSCFMAANHRMEKYVTVLQIAVCVLATGFLTLPYMTSSFKSSHSQPSIYETLIIGHTPATNIHDHLHQDHRAPILTWEMYSKYCNQPAWEHVNRITTQLRCSHLDETFVKWEGSIVSAEISRVHNIRAELLHNYLPKIVGDFVSCWYGEKNEPMCSSREQCEEMKSFLVEQKKCNLNRWNKYEYSITVRMNSGILSKTSEVLLLAEHSFGNFTQRLNNSDKIWFKGWLRNGRNTDGKLASDMPLGNVKPIVHLKAIGCIHCQSKDIDSFEIVDSDSRGARGGVGVGRTSGVTLTVNGRVQDLYRGVKYLLNVLFNPLVIFK